MPRPSAPNPSPIPTRPAHQGAPPPFRSRPERRSAGAADTPRPIIWTSDTDALLGLLQIRRSEPHIAARERRQLGELRRQILERLIPTLPADDQAIIARAVTQMEFDSVRTRRRRFREDAAADPDLRIADGGETSRHINAMGDAVYRDPMLNGLTLKILLYLRSLATHETDYECAPRTADIQRVCQCGRSTVYRALHLLEGRGFIERHTTPADPDMGKMATERVISLTTLCVPDRLRCTGRPRTAYLCTPQTQTKRRTTSQNTVPMAGRERLTEPFKDPPPPPAGPLKDPPLFPYAGRWSYIRGLDTRLQ